MIKLITSFLVAPAASVALLASSASAALIYEPFAYNNGSLAGNTNPTAPATLNGFNDTNVWTSTSATAVEVVDGDLSYPGLPTSPSGHKGRTQASNLNPVRIGIGEYAPGSTIYFSLLVQVPEGVASYGATSTSGSFYGGFQYNPSSISGGAMNSNTATGGGVLLIRKDEATDGYNLGIGYRDAAGARVFDTTKFVGGETVLLVGKLDINPTSQDDVATLYINPDPTGAEPLLASVVSANNSGSGIHDYMYNATTGAELETRIRSFFLRSNAVEPSNIYVDHVRIGSSWDEVTGQSVVIPEPATIGLLGMVAFGLLTARRRGI